MKHLRIVSVLGILLGAACIMPAHAEQGACMADMKKFCGDVKPGDGAIRDCMKAHEADLSQGCKDNIAKGKKWMDDVLQACQADLKQFCPNVTPGEGRELACLHAYDDKISAGCKDKMPKPRRMMHGS